MQALRNVPERFKVFSLEEKITFVGLSLFVLALVIYIIANISDAIAGFETLLQAGPVVLTIAALCWFLPDETDWSYVFMQTFWLSVLVWLALAAAAATAAFAVRGDALPAAVSGVMCGVVIGTVVQGYAEAVYGTVMGLMALGERGAVLTVEWMGKQAQRAWARLMKESRS